MLAPAVLSLAPFSLSREQSRNNRSLPSDSASSFALPGSLTRLIARGETRRKRIDRAILKSSTTGEKQGRNSRKRRARRSILRVFVQTSSCSVEMSSLIFCFRCLKDLIDEWLMVLQYLDSLKWLRFLTFEISLEKKNEEKL